MSVENRTNDHRYDRRKIVRQLRRDGWAAFEAGVKYAACPHRYMDAFQWQQGWRDAEAAHDAEMRDNEESQ